jgi:hypothetical protein
VTSRGEPLEGIIAARCWGGDLVAMDDMVSGRTGYSYWWNGMWVRGIEKKRQASKGRMIDERRGEREREGETI